MSTLFPHGIKHVTDLPHILFDAIRAALLYLGWEDLPKEEQPPKRIWTDIKALEEHFREVEKARERKWNTDKDGGSREIEDPVSNDAASSLIVE